MEYLVSWDIQLEADTPREAAEIAQAIQRDPFSVATGFRVTNPETGENWHIDTEED